MKKIISIAIFGAALGLPTIANAATDGSLGATSSGSLDISMSVLSAPIAKVQVTGLQDVNFGNVVSGTIIPPIRQDGICIYLENASTFSIEFIPSNGQPNIGFALVSNFNGSAFNTYDYEFETADGTTFHTPTSGLTGSDTPGCTSDTFSALTISPRRVPAGDYRGTVYSGSLTLIVAPD